jgi:hypothetical protein
VQERDAVYRAIATQRDVRRGFLDKPPPRDIPLALHNSLRRLCEDYGRESRISLSRVISYDIYICEICEPEHGSEGARRA